MTGFEIITGLKEPLKIKDIDFRLQSINKGGYATILSYKDARVDMKRLDEVCGALWAKEYKTIDGNLYCGVGIKIEGEWVWKWDVGTESMTEKEKGQASDAFKRSCFNWGIGRELYDFPQISVKLNADEFTLQNERAKQTWNLKIKEWVWILEQDEEGVTLLTAKDQKGAVRYKFSPSNNTEAPREKTLDPKVKEIYSTKNEVELKAIWDANPALHKTEWFASAVHNQKSNLLSPA